MTDTVAVRLRDGSLWGIDAATVSDGRDEVVRRDWIVATGPLYREGRTPALVRCSEVVAVVAV